MTTLINFIKENRTELVQAIEKAYDQKPTSIKELSDWVMNDEGLYNWARSEGVRI